MKSIPDRHRIVGRRRTGLSGWAGVALSAAALVLAGCGSHPDFPEGAGVVSTLPAAAPTPTPAAGGTVPVAPDGAPASSGGSASPSPNQPFCDALKADQGRLSTMPTDRAAAAAIAPVWTNLAALAPAAISDTIHKISDAVNSLASGGSVPNPTDYLSWINASATWAVQNCQ